MTLPRINLRARPSPRLEMRAIPKYPGRIQGGTGITVEQEGGVATITFSGEGGVTDGDKGDITVSSTGTVWTIDSSAVTTAKIADANVTLAKLVDASGASLLLGRGAGSGSGDWQEISLGSNLSMSGTTLSASGGLSDGDKGDITVSSSGTVFTIDNDVVTYAKMQNVSATDRLLGRDTASAGDVEELTVGGGVEFTGSGGIQRSALTGDVTASAGSASTTIANDAVTFAKMQDIATDRLLGRDTASSGNVEEISLNATLEFTGSASIQRAALTGDVTASAGSNATTIANNAVTTAKIIDDAVTYAKIQDVSATDRLLGRDTAAAGIIEELTVGGGVEFTGSGGIQRSALTGDVTASAGSNATTIANDAVTTAKILNANVTFAKLLDATAASKLIGRGSAAGGGDFEEISLGTGLSMSGTTLSSTSGIDDVVEDTSPQLGGALDPNGFGVTTNWNPESSDGAALGTTSKMWSDLFLAAGGVINWNNGALTLTESSGALLFKDSGTENARISANGTVNIGRGTDNPTFEGAPVKFEITHDASAEFNTRFHAYGNNTFPNWNIFTKTRHASPGSHTAVNNADRLAILEFFGSDGTDYVSSSFISATCDAAPSTGAVPGRLTLLSTNTSSTDYISAALRPVTHETFMVERGHSADAAVVYPVTLMSWSFGTPATGHGVGLKFVVNNDGNERITGAVIESVSTDMTDNNEDFDLVLKTMAAGAAAAEGLRILSDKRTKFAGATNQKSATLTDGATVSLNAALGNIFELSAAGNRTIDVPTNAPSANQSQQITIRHKASGADRTLSLTTGSAGAFRFGTTITGLTATTSGKTDYIGAIYNQADDRWDVVSYSKGF